MALHKGQSRKTLGFNILGMLLAGLHKIHLLATTTKLDLTWEDLLSAINEYFYKIIYFLSLICFMLIHFSLTQRMQHFIFAFSLFPSLSPHIFLGLLLLVYISYINWVTDSALSISDSIWLLPFHWLISILPITLFMFRLFAFHLLHYCHSLISDFNKLPLPLPDLFIFLIAEPEYLTFDTILILSNIHSPQHQDSKQCTSDWNHLSTSHQCQNVHEKLVFVFLKCLQH